MVPAGTVNLSKGKPVTASDSLPVIGELPLLTDGDKSGSDGTYVEFGPGVQWVQIDLESPAKIAAVVVWHFHSQARAYHDVIVQISDDPEFKKGVETIYNNDDNNSAKLGTGSDPGIYRNLRGTVDRSQRQDGPATSASTATATPPTSSTTTSKSKFTVSPRSSASSLIRFLRGPACLAGPK